MSVDERFEELAASLGGFYRTWVAYLGIELGLFARLRDAGAAGLTREQLAHDTGCRPEPLESWIRAAHAFEFLSLADGSIVIDDDFAAVLLDEQRPEYLGGQVIAMVVASLDNDAAAEFFRTGRPIERPARHRQAIERLTRQDIAVFFEEVIGHMPNLVADLVRGGRVVDLHCGGGRWLIAMASRFPQLELLGVEFEPDTALRARENVAAAGLADRITIEEADIATFGHEGEFNLAYFQYALHQLPDQPAALRAAWRSLRPGGRLIVFDWCVPSRVDEDVSLGGQLLWGLQLEELLGGAGLLTREQFVDLFAEAGLPEPTAFDTPSGASVFRVKSPSR